MIIKSLLDAQKCEYNIIPKHRIAWLVGMVDVAATSVALLQALDVANKQRPS
jgi:hypothetical protein